MPLIIEKFPVPKYNKTDPKMPDPNWPKDEFKFNLKLTKNELEYLHRLVTREYKIYLRVGNKSDITDLDEKQYFLLGLTIKLKNKFLELG